MPRSHVLIGLALAFLMTAVPVAGAQSPAPLPQDRVAVYQEPAHLLLAEGPATLERGAERMAAAANMLVLAGDRLQTTTGRLELAFSDGTVLDLDRHSRM